LRNAHAGGDSQLLIVHADHQRGNVGAQALHDLCGGIKGAFRHQDEKLLATPATAEVLFANFSFHHTHHFHQYAVAHSVAMTVVDQLETIDIQHRSEERRVGKKSGLPASVVAFYK